MTTPNSGFGLVIKTSEYTGNFEREICAYLTGRVGECEVGEEFVDELEDKPNFDNIQNVADEHGCYRPVSLDEQGSSNDLIIFFETKPTEEQIKHIKKFAPVFDSVRKTLGNMAQFYVDKPVIEILDYELREYQHSVTKQDI